MAREHRREDLKTPLKLLGNNKQSGKRNNSLVKLKLRYEVIDLSSSSSSRTIHPQSKQVIVSKNKMYIKDAKQKTKA